jgi:hypothetical protein
LSLFAPISGVLELRKCATSGFKTDMFRKGRRKRLRSSTQTAPSPTQEQQFNSTLSVEHFVCLHSVSIGTFRAANMRSAKCEQSESPQF